MVSAQWAFLILGPQLARLGRVLYRSDRFSLGLLDVSPICLLEAPFRNDNAFACRSTDLWTSWPPATHDFDSVQVLPSRRKIHSLNFGSSLMMPSWAALVQGPVSCVAIVEDYWASLFLLSTTLATNPADYQQTHLKKDFWARALSRHRLE